MSQERFATSGEKTVDRIEYGIVGQDERAVLTAEFDTDLLPDFCHDGAVAEGAVEPGDDLVGVLGVFDLREVKAGGKWVEIAVTLEHIGGDPVHGLEVAVAAAIADIDDADVVAPEHFGELGNILEEGDSTWELEDRMRDLYTSLFIEYFSLKRSKRSDKLTNFCD